MPGVLIVEAIAQAGGALLLTEVEDRSDKVMMFTGIDRAKFRRPVSPGDQLRIGSGSHRLAFGAGHDRRENARLRIRWRQTRGRSYGFLPIGRQFTRTRIDW